MKFFWVSQAKRSKYTMFGANMNAAGHKPVSCWVEMYAHARKGDHMVGCFCHYKAKDKCCTNNQQLCSTCLPAFTAFSFVAQ